jgi:hypothetical protein
MVDACIGPIHYTPNDGYSLFITEHDFCGGWARFSGIGVGETVSIPGYGTFTATARGQVPNPGTTNDVIRVFGGFPPGHPADVHPRYQPDAADRPELSS